MSRRDERDHLNARASAAFCLASFFFCLVRKAGGMNGLMKACRRFPQVITPSSAMLSEVCRKACKSISVPIFLY